MRKFYCVMKRT